MCYPCVSLDSMDLIQAVQLVNRNFNWALISALLADEPES